MRLAIWAKRHGARIEKSAPRRRMIVFSPVPVDPAGLFELSDYHVIGPYWVDWERPNTRQCGRIVGGAFMFVLGRYS